jgi:hypothetical protein
MPSTFEGLSVRTYRNGKADYILFELLDNFPYSLSDQPVRAEIEYLYGCTRIGMSDRYTLRMLVTELWALTRNDWKIYPKFASETRIDGPIIHGTTDSAKSFHQAFETYLFANPPEKILVEGPRGAAINSQWDQSRLLQYFAWAGQAIDVGVAFSVDTFQVEYWFKLILQQLPDDDDPRVYPMALHALWSERLKELSPQIAWQCQVAGVTNFQYRMRYVGNGLKVWFAPADYTDWKPLAESPLPRDKWVANEAFALSYPPC